MSMTVSGTGRTTRSYGEGDRPAVLDLLNDQMLPGMPPITGERLRHALAARLPDDPPDQKALRNVVMDVLTNADGHFCGFGRRRRRMAWLWDHHGL